MVVISHIGQREPRHPNVVGTGDLPSGRVVRDQFSHFCMRRNISVQDFGIRSGINCCDFGTKNEKIDQF